MLALTAGASWTRLQRTAGRVSIRRSRRGLAGHVSVHSAVMLAPSASVP
ncbi:hypothetical protein [Mastigocoleus testarum]|nr:hypothetical protein [Mastigocoleus testarum]